MDPKYCLTSTNCGWLSFILGYVIVWVVPKGILRVAIVDPSEYEPNLGVASSSLLKLPLIMVSCIWEILF